LLTLVPTPIGNLQDISFRALEKFSQADVILCEDTRVTKQLLTLLSQKHDFQYNAEFISFFEHNQQKRLQSFDADFFEKEVVYVSDAGMPAISDPGAKLVQYCIENNIAYDVLPGANAAITAFAASGYEGTFLFYGFLSKEKRKKELEKLLQEKHYVIVYEAPHRIEKLVLEISALSPQRELFLAKEISKKFQTFYKDKACNLQLANTKGEWVVVIAPATSDKVELSIEEIRNLDISDKIKSKLLAKSGIKSAKEWYNELTKEKS
jgi:16S rRNA (cytidine1402-2'-O)-methyltransferase